MVNSWAWPATLTGGRRIERERQSILVSCGKTLVTRPGPGLRKASAPATPPCG
jgi:hypothetical protein